MSFIDDFVARLAGTDASGLAALSDQQRNALSLSAGGTGLGMLGRMVTGAEQVGYSKSLSDAASFNAAQLRQAGGQAQASAQRDAWAIDRQAQYLASSALATAAASGGGASDPTVINLIAKNASEMAYRKSVALYGGDDQARVANLRADVADYEGKAKSRNALLSGVLGSVGGSAEKALTGTMRGTSMFQRFAGKGPLVDSMDTL